MISHVKLVAVLGYLLLGCAADEASDPAPAVQTQPDAAPAEATAMVQAVSASCSVMLSTVNVTATYDVTLTPNGFFTTDTEVVDAPPAGGSLPSAAFTCGDWQPVDGNQPAQLGCKRAAGDPGMQRVQMKRTHVLSALPNGVVSVDLHAWTTDDMSGGDASSSMRIACTDG